MKIIGKYERVQTKERVNKKEDTEETKTKERKPEVD